MNRRDVLKGLGAGAIALAVGEIARCEAPSWRVVRAVRYPWQGTLRDWRLYYSYTGPPSDFLLVVGKSIGVVNKNVYHGAEPGRLIFTNATYTKRGTTIVGHWDLYEQSHPWTPATLIDRDGWKYEIPVYQTADFSAILPLCEWVDVENPASVCLCGHTSKGTCRRCGEDVG